MSSANMTDSSITLETAGSADIDRVEQLLQSNDLPHQDVRDNPRQFVVATAGGEFIGIGGVEIYGSNGLLRSVVVMESQRAQGYGTALTDALESYARTNGVDTLYLLTTTAAAFFRGCGYTETDRETVPEQIRETTQFSDLCPSSATCLRKRL